MCDMDEHYLIVGLRGIVLVDVIETIKAAFPKFSAITAQTTLEAAALAANLTSVRFAFLNVDPDDFVRTELASLLSDLGTRIVLMGNAAEEKAAQSPFAVLDRPFAEHDLLRLVTKES